MKYDRRLNILFYLLSLAGALALVIPPVLRGDHIAIYAASAFLWILLCAMLFQFLAVRKLNAVMALLESCRTEEYIARYRELVQNASGSSAYALKLNLSAGYLEAGRAREALELLQSLPLVPEGRGKTALELLYDNNHLVACRMLDRLEEADRALETFRAHLDAAPPRTPQLEQFRRSFQSQSVLLRMTRGDFEGAEAYWQEDLESSARTLRHVAADRYALGWTLHALGRAEESREHLAWVAENGGDTWYAASAREKLAALPEAKEEA